jgi:DNA-binding NarL/FixJ family response regulator
MVALVRELHPDWSLEVAQTSVCARGLVSLTIAESGRWMALLTNPCDYEGAAAALADGANAVITIYADAAQFELAMRAMVDGGAPYMTADLARGIARDLLAKGLPQQPAAPSLPPLTARETQVLELVAAGLSNREVAERLTLSINTVRSHLQTISTKLRATSRTKMVASAWGSGIVPVKESPDKVAS